MTNYLKTAYDQLITYIKTQYPRFADPERLQVGYVQEGVLEFVHSALGYEDCLILYVEDDAEELVVPLTSGKSIVNYNLKLLYLKPKLINDQLDDVSDFVDPFRNWLMENYMHVSGKWVNLGVDISYDPPKPESYEGNLFGALMTITFDVAKY